MQGRAVDQPTRDPNALVEGYRSYARAIAAEVAHKCGSWIEREELENAADLGLVEAAVAFDPGRGVQFTTFSYYRIRGAVFDFLRKVGMRPSTFEVAANEYMKDVASAGAAGNAEQECSEIRSIAGSLATCHLLSLEAINLQIADKSAVSPEEQMLKSERRTALRKALDQLPSRKKQVLEDYYYRGVSMDEIGRGLGLSRSRISRIHAKSLELLRSIMLEGSTPPNRPAEEGTVPAKSGPGSSKRVNRTRQLSANPFDKQTVRP